MRQGNFFLYIKYRSVAQVLLQACSATRNEEFLSAEANTKKAGGRNARLVEKKQQAFGENMKCVSSIPSTSLRLLPYRDCSLLWSFYGLLFTGSLNDPNFNYSGHNEYSVRNDINFTVVAKLHGINKPLFIIRC
jgi:hypothetical protein